MRIVWMNVNDCVFIPHNHISSHDGLQFLLTEIERQLVKAPLAAAIGTYLISLTVPTEPMHEMWDETWDRPPHRELRALLFSIVKAISHLQVAVSSVCKQIFAFNHSCGNEFFLHVRCLANQTPFQSLYINPFQEIRSLRLRLITITSALIIPDITKPYPVIVCYYTL